MTYYLLDFAPDGSQEVLQYTASDMKEIFTAEQRELLTKGERIIHHWSKNKFGMNHAICDMIVTANQKWGK